MTRSGSILSWPLEWYATHMHTKDRASWSFVSLVETWELVIPFEVGVFSAVWLGT